MAENNKKMGDTVATFKSKDRVVAMYFSEAEDGQLDMQMSVDPSIKEGEEPDGPLMLASLLLSALKIDLNEPKVYDGQD